MSGKLLKEIGQTKPFASVEEEALVNLFRTAALLQREHEAVLRPFGVTPVAYNILRILRGSEPQGLRCQDIRARLITPGPDVTRLLDGLEAKKLSQRVRSESDRRAVVSRITPAGLALLAKLDPVVREMPRTLLGHLGEGKVRKLVDLLEDARG